MTPEQKTILENYRKEWNVPDWRNASNYDYANNQKLSDHALRWEFYRRNLGYRATWDSGDFANDLDLCLKQRLSPWTACVSLPDDFRFFDDSIVGTIFDPYAFRRDVFDLKEVRQLFREIKNAQWFSHEDQNKGAAKLVIRDVMDAKLEEFVGRRVIDLVNRGYVLIPFSPDIKLGSQLKIANQSLQATKQKRRNKERTSAETAKNDNATLLRVLDALNEFEFLGLATKAKTEELQASKVAAAKLIFQRRLELNCESENLALTYFKQAVATGHERAMRPSLPDSTPIK